MQTEVLDKWDPSDPRSSGRDYGVEARSTTALRKCVDAFTVFTESPEKLAKAKDRLRKAVRPEDKAKALRDYEQALRVCEEAPQKLAKARLHFKATVGQPVAQEPENGNSGIGRHGSNGPSTGRGCCMAGLMPSTATSSVKSFNKHPHNEIGHASCDPVRPIGNSNRAINVGSCERNRNLVVGAIHSDGGNEASSH